jgi:hypothetical protein
MAGMLKRITELKALIESFNIEVLDSCVHRGHIQMQCRAPDGREKRFVFSGSPSDHRTLGKRRQDLRRWLTGVYKQ